MPKYEFVAVDFDGTLCADAFPEVGAPNRAVIDYVKRLAADGSKIILYTSRENGTRKLLDEAVAFCKAQEIPLYAVNENPGNPHAAKIGLKPSDGRKVYADLYIDDKAINPAEIERTAEYTRPGAFTPPPEAAAEDDRWQEIMKQADVPHSDLVIACASADEMNMLSCLIARRLGAKHTIARVRNPIYYSQIGILKEDLHLSMAVNPELAASNEILRVLLFPEASKVETFMKGRVELVEYAVGAD